MKKLFIVFIIINFFQTPSFSQYFTNYSDVGLSFDKLNLTPLDSNLDNYELIIVGEAHYHDENQIFQYGLLKYLHQNLGIKHIVLEANESVAIFINQFLKTGDKKYLRQDVLNQDQYMFYKLVKDYYDTLPLDKKFIFHGIDYMKNIQLVEHSIDIIINETSSQGVELSENSKKFKLTNITSYNETEMMVKCSLFLNELSKDSLKYKKEFGSNYGSLMRIYESIKANVENPKYNMKVKHESMRNKRESLIYNQMLNLKIQYPNQKFYAIYGGAHTPLFKHDKYSNISNFEPFVSRLNSYEESPFNAKILSIKCIYAGKIYNWKKKNLRNNFGLNMEELNEIDEKSKNNNLTLFKYPTRDERQREFAKNYYQYILISRMNFW